MPVDFENSYFSFTMIVFQTEFSLHTLCSNFILLNTTDRDIINIQDVPGLLVRTVRGVRGHHKNSYLHNKL